MHSDGVSLPTTISQMGSVAKTQSRAQQQAQQTTPFKDQLDKTEELKPQRVQKTEAADHRRIEEEDERADKRQKRRRRREQKLLARADDDDDGAAAPAAETSDEQDADKVGGLIDLRA